MTRKTKISTKSIFHTINLILVLSLFYSLGGAIAHLIHQQVLIPPAPHSPTQISPKPQPKDNPKSRQTFESILERNIFNAERKVMEVDAPPVVPTKKVESHLNLQLIGTMIFNKTAFAFIKVIGTPNNGEVFQLYSCFHPSQLLLDEYCADNSVKIEKIENRKVILLYNGKEEILMMADEVDILSTLQDSPQEPTSPKVAIPAPRSSTPPASVAAALPKTSTASTPQNVGGSTFYFKRDWVDQQLANFNQILQDARVVPTKINEKTFFKFRFIKKGSVYEQLGLKKNDIILEINGSTVDNITKAMGLMTALQSEKEIILKVKRGEEEKLLNYFID